MSPPSGGEEVVDEKPLDILQVPGIRLEARCVLLNSLSISRDKKKNCFLTSVIKEQSTG